MEARESEAAPNIVAFASRCSLHGIGHVFLVGPLTPRRAAWAAAVLAALGVVLYQVGERVQYYAEYDHVTALDEGKSRRLTFPAVSFCNVNRIRRSRLTPNDLHWVGRELLGLELSDYPAYGRALGWLDPEAFRTFPSRSFSLHEFMDRTSHSLEDMLLDCRFGNQPCDAKNFSPGTQFTPGDYVGYVSRIWRRLMPSQHNLIRPAEWLTGRRQLAQFSMTSLPPFGGLETRRPECLDPVSNPQAYLKEQLCQCRDIRERNGEQKRNERLRWKEDSASGQSSSPDKESVEIATSTPDSGSSQGGSKTVIAGGLKALRNRRSFCSKLLSHPRQSLNLPALLASEENGEGQAESGQGLSGLGQLVDREG